MWTAKTVQKLRNVCLHASLKTWKCQILQAKFPINEMLNLTLVECSSKKK